jgi:hypothetical protein
MSRRLIGEMMNSNLHPVIATALRAWMPMTPMIADPRDSLLLEDDDADDNDETADETDDEGGICPACSGSGEGRYEGSTCYSCKGSGVFK